METTTPSTISRALTCNMHQLWSRVSRCSKVCPRPPDSCEGPYGRSVPIGSSMATPSCERGAFNIALLKPFVFLPNTFKRTPSPLPGIHTGCTFPCIPSSNGLSPRVIPRLVDSKASYHDHSERAVPRRPFFIRSPAQDGKNAYESTLKPQNSPEGRIPVKLKPKARN